MTGDTMKLVGKEMNKKEFFSLFSWKKIIKLYIMLTLYVIVFGIVFFSTEQCLKNESPEETLKEIVPTQDPGIKKCTKIPSHAGQGIHEHDDVKNGTNDRKDDVVIILKCNVVKKNKKPPHKHKCTITPVNILRWVYFVVLNLLGTDTASLHLTSRWGQVIAGPVLIVGMVMTVRLYACVGFVAVNIINFCVRKLRGRLRLHRKVSLKYEILAISTLLLILYILTCAGVSTIFAKEEGTFNQMVYRWIMISLTISDKKLTENSFQALRIIIPIILIWIGFIFTSTFVGAIINAKYRLTYKVNAHPHKKKAGLQGWWV